MDVFLANEQEVPVDEARLSTLAGHVLTAEDVSAAELSLLLVTAGHMRRLNRRFANDDYATDVLAFPMMEDDDDGVVLGDVVICPAIAGRNARKLGHSLQAEVETLVVHGTLHLLGYDHEAADDRVRMDGRLEEILASFEPSGG